MSPRTYYRNISKTKKARFAPRIDIEPVGIPIIQDNIESIDIQSNIIQSINDQTSDDQTTDNQSSENQSSDNQSSDNQDNFSFFQELNEVFQNETVTKEDLAAGYLTAFYNGRDSQKSLSNYLCLSNIGSSIKLPCNYNGLKSFLNKNKKKVNFEKTWYCGVCQKIFTKLNDRHQRECSSCTTTRLCMYYHLNIEVQIQNIMDKLKLSDLRRTISEDLCDFTDGDIYKRLLASSDGHLFKKMCAFSLTMNTDGISHSDSSKLTVWPVWLIINELPLNIRFSIDNVILAGLSVGEEKPNTDLFFNPIVIKLKKLEIGINISIENVIRHTKIFCVACVCDKPAKSALLNMIGCTGFYGCTKCLQLAKSFKTSELKNLEDESIKHDGTVRLYTFSNEWKNKRTEEIYNNDLIRVKANIVAKVKDPSINGIKGPCILSSLKHFHPISSTCVDYMHSVLEGVVKNFFKYWFGSEFSSNSFSLRKFMKEIDIRLCRIKPPKFVPTKPRSLYSYNLWSAHEYLTFILFYSLPVFKDIMSQAHYENIKKLVLFLETILAEKINVERLKKVEFFLVEFVSELEILYSKSIMLSGVHELLHLTECTIDFGPLNSTNCFQFEEMNRKLIGFLHGFDLIGEELIKIFSGAQVLSIYSNNVKNKKLQKFIKSKIEFRTSNKKNRFDYSTDDISIRSKMQTATSEYIQAFKIFIRYEVNDLSFFNDIKFNGVHYTSVYCKTKRCDACFKTQNNEIGLIQCFVIHNNTVYVIAKRIISLFNSFYSPMCPEIRSSMVYCYVSNQLFVHELKNITKTVLVYDYDDNCFVSLFKSSHLFS